jgi:hypothetical protein
MVAHPMMHRSISSSWPRRATAVTTRGASGPGFVLLFLLDSGHLAAHGGAQAQWLERELAAHASVPVRLATYHVSLLPGFRLPTTHYSKQGRKHWQPLFDRYELMAAFENHDHVFKRSHPIRGD